MKHGTNEAQPCAGHCHTHTHTHTHSLPTPPVSYKNARRPLLVCLFNQLTRTAVNLPPGRAQLPRVRNPRVSPSVDTRCVGPVRERTVDVCPVLLGHGRAESPATKQRPPGIPVSRGPHFSDSEDGCTSSLKGAVGVSFWEPSRQELLNFLI